MKFETKFNLNDSAWRMNGNRPSKVFISAIYISYVDTGRGAPLNYSYNVRNDENSHGEIDHIDIDESNLFKTKKVLLESIFNATICKGKNCTAIDGLGHSKECEQDHDNTVKPKELFHGTMAALNKLKI